ncbi:MAG: hypothetical protein WDO74_34955 [Pseudomonadota bacterium]
MASAMTGSSNSFVHPRLSTWGRNDHDTALIALFEKINQRGASSCVYERRPKSSKTSALALVELLKQLQIFACCFRRSDLFEEQIDRHESGRDAFGAQAPAERDGEVSPCLAGLTEQQ